MSDLVEQAIKSGLWREKVDPRTKRTYYVHSKTKEATWNLAKYFSKQGITSLETGTSAKKEGAEYVDPSTLRDKRQEEARKRAEDESLLRTSVTTLERQKAELEAEVARLTGPIEAENQSLEELRREVADAEASLQNVERDVLEKRRQRKREMEELQTKVSSLRAIMENERKHKEAVERRHAQLVSESLELKGDIFKEQSTADALRTAVRTAERKLEELDAEKSRQDHEIMLKEEEARLAQEELIRVSKQKAEMEATILDGDREIAEIKARIEKNSTAHERKVTHDKNEVLTKLVQAHVSKKKRLRNIKTIQQNREDITELAAQNEACKKLFQSCRKDEKALKDLEKVLQFETQRVSGVVSHYRTEAARLKDELRALPGTK